MWVLYATIFQCSERTVLAFLQNCRDTVVQWKSTALEWARTQYEYQPHCFQQAKSTTYVTVYLIVTQDKWDLSRGFDRGNEVNGKTQNPWYKVNAGKMYLFGRPTDFLVIHEELEYKGTGCTGGEERQIWIAKWKKTNVLRSKYHLWVKICVGFRWHYHSVQSAISPQFPQPFGIQKMIT